MSALKPSDSEIPSSHRLPLPQAVGQKGTPLHKQTKTTKVAKKKLPATQTETSSRKHKKITKEIPKAGAASTAEKAKSTAPVKSILKKPFKPITPASTVRVPGPDITRKGQEKPKLTEQQLDRELKGTSPLRFKKEIGMTETEAGMDKSRVSSIDAPEGQGEAVEMGDQTYSPGDIEENLETLEINEYASPEDLTQMFVQSTSGILVFLAIAKKIDIDAYRRLQANLESIYSETLNRQISGEIPLEPTEEVIPTDDDEIHLRLRSMANDYIDFFDSMPKKLEKEIRELQEEGVFSALDEIEKEIEKEERGTLKKEEGEKPKSDFHLHLKKILHKLAIKHGKTKDVQEKLKLLKQFKLLNVFKRDFDLYQSLTTKQNLPPVVDMVKLMYPGLDVDPKDPEQRKSIEQLKQFLTNVEELFSKQTPLKIILDKANQLESNERYMTMLKKIKDGFE